MLKDIILWKYERASWQWDLLCCLIMLFIFLTPKTWFDRKEKLTALNASLVLKAKDVSPNRAESEKRIRWISGNPNAVIIKINERKTDGGESFYELEIR